MRTFYDYEAYAKWRDNGGDPNESVRLVGFHAFGDRAQHDETRLEKRYKFEGLKSAAQICLKERDRLLAEAEAFTPKTMDDVRQLDKLLAASSEANTIRKLILNSVSDIEKEN